MHKAVSMAAPEWLFALLSSRMWGAKLISSPRAKLAKKLANGSMEAAASAAAAAEEEEDDDDEDDDDDDGDDDDPA